MAISYNPTQMTNATTASTFRSKSQAGKKMTYREYHRYKRKAKFDAKLANKELKAKGRQIRKNLKAAASENFKEKQLMHGTIRQGLAEGATLIGQMIAPKTTSGIVNAISQNTEGGTRQQQSSSDQDKTIPQNGPVNAVKYSYDKRDEED